MKLTFKLVSLRIAFSIHKSSRPPYIFTRHDSLVGSRTTRSWKVVSSLAIQHSKRRHNFSASRSAGAHEWILLGEYILTEGQDNSWIVKYILTRHDSLVDSRATRSWEVVSSLAVLYSKWWYDLSAPRSSRVHEWILPGEYILRARRFVDAEGYAKRY